MSIFSSSIFCNSMTQNSDEKEMYGSEVSEPLIEKWELIQSSIPPPKHQSLVVIKDNYFHHESAVFPPSHHEDLQVAPRDIQFPDESPSSPSSNSEASFGSSERPEIPDLRARVVAETTWCLRLSWEALKSKLISRFCRFGLSAASLWSVLPLTAMAALTLLSLFYLKIRLPWRRTVHRDNQDRLLFLIKEKDEKISRLLLQVAQMNEKLSAPRRVPVLRIK